MNLQSLILFYLLTLASCASTNNLRPRYTSDCKNSDQVLQDIFFGYWSGTKTESNKNDALGALDSLNSYLSSFSDRESFKVQHGNVIGFMWVGSMVQNSGFVWGDAISILRDEVKNNGIPDMIYIEYVDSDPMKTFGVTLNTGGSDKLKDVQRAVKLWSQGKHYGTNTGSKIYSDKRICYLSYSNRKLLQNDKEAGECYSAKMQSGKSAESVCGVNGVSVAGYNPDLDFSALQVGQPICCSVGNLPNNKPSKNKDGSCYSYSVEEGDTCDSIRASYYPLSTDDLNDYNKKTYGWYGCKKLQKDQKICLSDGTPPRPTPNPKAECGPLAPDDLYLSECPNKACCSEFGFCGLTSEFCDKKDSSTGAPGTDGCYSNCGYGTLPTKKASSFKSVGYWLDSDTMNTDPTSYTNYDIIHYSFGDISDDFSISVGSHFDDFMKVKAKKIIAFGGWEFSTSSSTYHIFRDGVQDDNIDTFANNIIDFVNSKNLDGVNFDWEYPGAPDIPGIPADDKKNGKRYSDLIGKVKKGLGSKLVSVAIPISYWYLKAFPLHEMDGHMDYFVLMNYDYYGQWDYGKGIGIGCHVDHKNTTEAIKMIVKSGIDTTKVYGGLANYARTYQLSDSSCHEYGCGFTGPDSGAEPGDFTKTPGIMTEDELLQIDNSKRSRWTDTDSWCDIMTYEDGTNWGAWMKIEYRQKLTDWYDDIGLGGYSLWALNYDKGSGDDGDDDDSEAENSDWEQEAGDFEYIDLLGCMDYDIKDQDDIKGECIFEKTISYTLNMADIAFDNLTRLQNDGHYHDHYKSFTEMIQNQIMGEYSNSVFAATVYKKEQNDYLKCPDYDLCGQYITDHHTGGCISFKQEHDKHSGGPIPFNFVFNNSTKRDSFDDQDGVSFDKYIDQCVKSGYRGYTVFEDVKAKDKKKLASFAGDRLSVSLTQDDLEIGDWTNSNLPGLRDSGYTTFIDCVIPKAVKIIPDPMKNMTDDYVSDTKDLVKQIKKEFGETAPIYILDTLYPVMSFVSSVSYIDYINEAGKTYETIQAKERKEMIFMLVTSIVGMLTAPLGVTGFIIDAITILVGWGITGDVNPLDLIGLLGGVGSAFKSTGKISKIANDVEVSPSNKFKLNSLKFVKVINEKMDVQMCKK